MRRAGILVLAVALFAGTAATAAAQGNADPSFAGTTGLFYVPRASTLPKGGFSLGAYYDQVAREEGDSRIKTFGVMGAFGLADRLEAFFSFAPNVSIERRFTTEQALFGMHPSLTGTGLNEHPFADLRDQDGVGDLTVGFKYKIAGLSDEYGGMALAAFVKLPTADDTGGVGTGKFDVGGRLIGSLLAGDTVGLNAFVGYLWKGDPDPASRIVTLNGSLAGPLPFYVSNEFHYGLGAHFPVSSPIQVVLEANGIATSEDLEGSHVGGDDRFTVSGGLRMSLASGLSLGAAVNYNTSIDVRDPDWQEDAGIDGLLRRAGFAVLGAYTSGLGGSPVPTFAGTSPMAVPPVNGGPTLTCRAERTTVRQGESVRLFATTTDPDGDPVTVAWATSAGSITPTTGNEVTWSSAGVDPGSGPITARASDGYGGTADCELLVTVAEPPAPAMPTVLTFACSEFNTGSARIDNRCKAVLDDVALQLRQNSGATAAITGHSDAAGSAVRNQEMSEQRAENARMYLVQTHGIDGSRITTNGAGGTQPASSNDTSAGRSANRRIEVVVTIPAH